MPERFGQYCKLHTKKQQQTNISLPIFKRFTTRKFIQKCCCTAATGHEIPDGISNVDKFVMLPQDNQRMQYIYFLMSGVVASSLLILTYVSLLSRADEKIHDDLRSAQLSLELIKPSSLTWTYNNTWRYIGHSSLKHTIYSAYYDRRTDILDYPVMDSIRMVIGSIRIFAVFPLDFKQKITCIFRGEDFSLSKVSAEPFQPLMDHKDLTFAAYAIVCPVYRRMNESSRVRLPHSVAVAYKSNNLSHLSPTFVPISYPRDMDQLFAQSKPVLSVCVTPARLNTSDVLRLVEFVEMYRLLGAKHFYFYSISSSRDIARVLSFYASKGLAETLQWNVNDHMDDLSAAGEVAQINDCIFRAMVVDNYRYAAVVGLDEILIPLKHNSLMHFLLQCDEGLTSSFVFRNVFFYRRDRSDAFSVPAKTRNTLLYTQNKVRRIQEVMPAYASSKFIVNTHTIVAMGTTRMWRSAPGYADHILVHSVGLLFHYRDKCINCRGALVVDYTARRFGSLLWDQVDDTCLQVFLTQKGMCPTK